MSDIVEKMKQLIQTETEAEIIEIVDQSAGHAGHGADGGHFMALIVSEKFKGLGLVQRHQLVYKAIAPVKEAVHAFSMRTHSPEEWSAQK
ncbi:MAG TPA: BolA family protein [Candidatus Omnitrophota bacterium]|nr:BolA family protein [Candidatus Omnitrophota bacterium]